MMTTGRKQGTFDDKFYTRRDVAAACLGIIDADLRAADCAVEPSAGDGAFLLPLTGGPGRNNRLNVIAMDTEPATAGLGRCDFLEFSMPACGHESIVVFGNPPWGSAHRMSDAFLKHAFNLNDAVGVVAFILPETYRKPNRQKIIPASWRIRQIVRLPRNSFVRPGGKAFNIDASFFVFDRNISAGRDLRAPKTASHPDFTWSSRSKPFDFFVFGTNPGRTADRPGPSNRGYFIKAAPGMDAGAVRARFESVDWQHLGRSCASGGVAWFSKPEIVAGYQGIVA